MNPYELILASLLAGAIGVAVGYECTSWMNRVEARKRAGANQPTDTSDYLTPAQFRDKFADTITDTPMEPEDVLEAEKRKGKRKRGFYS